MRYRVFAAGLLVIALTGQEAVPQDPEQAAIRARTNAAGWAAGVAERFATLSNTVVSTYALERLASLACADDPNAASGIFRRAASRMGSIPPQIFFDDRVPRLPIASFTRLWQTAMADAKECNPALSALFDTEAFARRRSEERQYANNSAISRALNRYEEDPERAAQLADLVLDAGDPVSIDFGGLEFFLAKLRERSPELADDVFRHALDTVVAAPAPGMLDLDELGKYLFLDPYPDHVGRPDELNLFRAFTVGNVSVYDFRVIRESANPDLVGAYIDALRQMVEQALTPQPGNPLANNRYEPTVAYSLALQLSAHARELDLESVNTLNQLLLKIDTSTSAQVRALLIIPPEVTDERAVRRRRIREIVTAVRRNRFEDARRAINGVGDERTTRQLVPLIDFAEASAALSRGDIAATASLTNRMQPGGVKRGMLYAGIVFKLPNPQHESYVATGARDAQSLPPEFRAAVFSAIAAALLEQNNPERAYSILREIVAALDEARINPRQGRFDPRSLRGIRTESSQGAGSTTDVPSIPLAFHRFYLVIDTGESRVNYELAVSGVSTFSLPGVIRKAQALDPTRLEALVTNVRDEWKQAEALLAIAELRFPMREVSAVTRTTPESAGASQAYAIGWANGLAARFSTISNTVVSAHSLARLAAATCPYDRNAALGMFLRTVSRMGSIPERIFFDEQTPRLPVASFTRLWQMTMGAAKECDPSLPGLLDTEAFARRRADERQNANNSIIASAMNRYDTDPDRSAQLVELVLEAGDPGAIDFSMVSLFAARLRDRSPELGDDVFRHALQTVVDAPSPGTAHLNELGKYLFVDAGQATQPDDQNLFRAVTIGSSTVYDFRRIRMSASPDLVTVYIGALQRLVERASTPQLNNPLAAIRYDPTIAYALVLQLSKHARDLDLAAANTLGQFTSRTYTNMAAQVEAAIGTLAPDLERGVVDERNRRVREWLTFVRQGKFTDARRTMNGIGDIATTRQLSSLIDFVEELPPTSIQPGGVKRALRYAQAVKASGSGSAADAGRREAQFLPPEYRAAMLSALATAMSQANKPDEAYLILRDVVPAMNNARTTPRTARLDPRGARGSATAAQGAGGNTDVSMIPYGENRFYQVIDTGGGRFSYELSVPGVSTFTLPGAIRQAQNIDPMKLEALVTSVRDEWKRSEALLAVAELRFSKLPTPDKRGN